MSTIVPAILPVSQEDLENKLVLLIGLVESVQIDIVDGKFVAPASWPYVSGEGAATKAILSGVEMLPHVGQIQFEMDLMVTAPEELTGPWIAAGANRITLHAESTRNLSQLIGDMAVTYGHSKDFAPNLLSLGLALNIDTDLSLIEPFLDRIDYVQFMGIARIGRQGEPFDPRVLRKIAVFKQKHPTIVLQVDGGVSLDTAPTLMAAGIDRLIVGSGIWHSDDPASVVF
jgi:ribulose-phosphate 3-epimerase